MRLDIERIHKAMLAIGDSELRYLIDEGKYLEAASRIVEEDARQPQPEWTPPQFADHQGVHRAGYRSDCPACRAWDEVLDRTPDFGQQLAAKGGPLHPDVAMAIENGGGWPSGVPVPEPLSIVETVKRRVRR